MAGGTLVPVSDILGRLSDHLDMLAGQVLATEEAVGSALREDHARLENAMGRLQSLDYLRQSLEDCAILTLSLAAQQNGENGLVSIDQLDPKLRLETTKDLLVPHGRERQRGGDVHLF